jgi:P27 family predicted phage terminase small subunit
VGTVRGPGIRGEGLPKRVRIPELVRANADATAIWRELFPLLHPRLVKTDLPAFVDLCVVYGQMRKAERELEAAGFTSTGHNGEVVRHPLNTVVKGLRADWRAGCDRFGLTPAGRGRLPPAQEQEQGATLLDAFFAKVRAAAPDPGDEWTL